MFNPLNAELNPICHLLALLGGATIVVVSRLRVKPLTVGKREVDGWTDGRMDGWTDGRTEFANTAFSFNL